MSNPPPEAYETLKRSPNQRTKDEAPTVGKMTKFEKTVITLLAVNLCVGPALVALAAAILALSVKDSTSYTSTPTTTACPAPAVTSSTLAAGNCVIKLRAFGLNDVEQPFLASITVNGTVYFNATYISVNSNGLRGIDIMMLDPLTCTASNLANFDTCCDPNAANSLVNFISSVPTGRIMLGVTLDSATNMLSNAWPTLAMLNVNVSSLTPILQDRSKFAFVVEQGYPSKTVMALADSGGNALLLDVQLKGKPDTIDFTQIS